MSDDQEMWLPKQLLFYSYLHLSMCRVKSVPGKPRDIFNLCLRTRTQLLVLFLMKNFIPDSVGSVSFPTVA
jgi:hypothetical protein